MSAEKATPQRRVVLISIDGWGLSDDDKGNAIKEANPPVMSQFLKPDCKWLHAQLDASGHAVGLPKGLMGNSEVGHLTMGAGRVQFQDLERINAAIEDGTFKTNEELHRAMGRAKSLSAKLHLLGLVSDGGVHSHINHLFALLELAKQLGVPKTYVHFFADGRDTPPASAVKYIEQLQAFIKQLGYGKIATVMGRYYAMDRDKRWERTQIAYEGLTLGKGEDTTPDKLIDTVKARYEAKETDEFLKPIIVDKEGMVEDNDTMIFFNFRSDRMRQIVENFAFELKFDSPKRQNVAVYQFTQYNPAWTGKLPIVFPPQSMDNVLAEWISKQGLKQFHTAETEKYAHVTFFFNGGREIQFEGEDRVLVPSPKVPTYDLKPEMSVQEVATEVIKAIESGKYPFIMCNFAPPDMVGHTGVFDATVKAVRATDHAVGRVLEAALKHNYVLVVTADHGNAEEMIDEHDRPKTAHTTRLVPLNIAWPDSMPFPFKLARQRGGLSDVAPTVLHIMGLPIPKEMTGKSMLESTA